MSTKTTFKRVALVAVAALGIGMLSAIPSNAAPTLTNTTMYDTTNGYQIVGGQATITLTNDTATSSSATNGNSNVALSGVGSLVSATAISGTGETPATVSAGTTSWSVYGGTGALATYAIILTSSVAGTQTITVTPMTATGTPGTAVTKTITWLASSSTAVSASTSTAYLISGSGTHVGVTTDTAIVAPMGTAKVANIAVSPKDANSAALSGQVLSATITGPGLLAWSEVDGGPAIGTARAVSATIAGTIGYLTISGDGTAGVATITISAGSTVLSTKTVTFTGAAATYTATPSFTNYAVGANGLNGTTGNGAIAVLVKDAGGNVVNGATVNAVSSDTTKATVAASQTTNSLGYAYFAVQGQAAGTATITFANATTGATVTATSPVVVTSSVASTVTLAFDKASYAPGEKMVLTLTAKDATGAGLADGSYALFFASGTGLTSNVALQNLPSPVSSTVVLAGGVETWTVYAPLAAGTITVSATTGVSANLATAVQSLALSASANIAGDTTAVDAANAATDAANYAADAADAATTAAQEATAAAQAAQDSADAATAAVVALGLRVNVLMASVRAQLTSLSNLLVRIIKKTHA